MTRDAPKRLIFKPLVVIGAAVSAGLTILLGMLQVGAWINAHAVWVLWGVIAALIVALLVLIARVAAVREALVSAERAVVKAENRAAKAARGAADAANTEMQIEPPSSAVPSKLDQALADQLFEYASDPEVLMTLGLFFPYQIPRTAVRQIEELAELPMTRTAHNAVLMEHLESLAHCAQLWRSKLLPLISLHGDYFTTRLERHVPEEAYKRHSADTDELGEVGFELHEKLLGYQRYYASL